MANSERINAATLYYAHDPMCSWCWAFAPAFEALETSLSPVIGDRLQIRKLLGGLAPDSDALMPESMQQFLQRTWATIQQRVPGTAFNFDFWTRCRPCRSTWPACRAVIAARAQGANRDTAMNQAIQQAYYLDARNPSERDTLIALAGEIDLDVPRFAADLDAPHTRAAHTVEMDLARHLGVRGFPGLILVDGDQAQEIRVDFYGPTAMQAQVTALVEDGRTD